MKTYIAEHCNTEHYNTFIQIKNAEFDGHRHTPACHTTAQEDSTNHLQGQQDNLRLSVFVTVVTSEEFTMRIRSLVIMSRMNKSNDGGGVVTIALMRDENDAAIMNDENEKIVKDDERSSDEMKLVSSPPNNTT